MPAVELTEQQVVDLVEQLPPGRKRAVLISLAEDAARSRDARMTMIEERFRIASAERGLDWDNLTEDERQEFIDRLVHEGRPCQ